MARTYDAERVALPSAPPGDGMGSESDPEQDELAAVFATLGEDGASLTVRLYQEARGGKLAFLRKFSPAEWIAFDIDGVQEEYGPGDYRVRVYDAKSKVRANKGFSIGTPTRINSPAPARETSQIDTAAVIRQTITELAQSLIPLLRPAPSKQEWLQELVTMRSLFAAPAAAPASAPVDALDMLQRLMAITKDMSPREGETGLADVMLQLTKEFGPLIARGMAQDTVAAPIVQPAVNPAPRRVMAGAPVPGAPVPPPKQESNDVQMKLAVQFLVSQAERQADASLYADLVIDQLADEVLERVMSMGDAEMLALLVSHDARAAAHAEWFASLRREMRALLLLTDAEEPGTNGAPGETGIAPPNDAAG